ncbi:MAG: DNA-processing protein DprA [Rhodobacteraceae bacterium]|nr:DNA-processing protein DprA [Paracoccaceae bacterium]
METSGISSSHPPLPPISEEDLFFCLRLLRSRRVGVATYNRLLSEHGSARAALQALPEIAREAGVKKYQICPEGVVIAEMKAARRAGARLLVQGTPDYPEALDDIDDAPPLLWARGPLDPNAQPQIALVGSRNASSLGRRMTRKLAQDLGSAGFAVTSGLARGIDTMAHEAALPTGTVAVVAGGVDVTYPPENAALMDKIAAEGLILSEMPIGLQPQSRHFPRRNRIISGLSRAVVVVEAAARSGTLITAEMALDQGRDVLAVPGHPFDARVAGCLRLIRDGATLIRGADDIFEVLGANLPETRPMRAAPASPPPAAAPPAARELAQVAELPQLVLERLAPTPLPEDQLIRDTGAHPDQISSVLVELELEGLIERQQGGFFALREG